MQDEKNPKEEPAQGHEMLDEEAEKQLAGVPEHLRDQSGDDVADGRPLLPAPRSCC